MNTERCPGLAQLSRAHADGLTEPMSSHVEGCARCASVLRGLDRLRTISRQLPYEEPSDAQLREVGRALLAQAEVVRPAPRRFLAIGAAAVGGAIAASLALYLAVGTPPASPAAPPAGNGSLAEITAAPGASYEHLTHHPSTPDGSLAEVVRLTSGSLQLHVQHLGDHQRFLVRAGDAEVEVRGTRFSVDVVQDLLQRVEVTEGKVEVRAEGRAPVLLLPGDRWDRAASAPAPVVTAPVLPPVAPERPREPAARAPHAQPIAAAPKPPLASARTAPAPDAAPPPAEEPAATPAQVPEPRPAEAAFAAGWDLLRAGDAAGAARHLAEVPDSDELAPEAAYWRIVALARCGDAAAAKDAMRRFLDRHGASPRAGEVSLMLGLRLIESGDREAARPLLERAAKDGADRVRDPARQALESF